MRSTTTQLIHQARNAKDITSFLAEHEADFLSETVGDYLTSLAEEKKLKISAIARDSLQGEYLYKVFRDQGERKIGRDVLCAVALAMQLDLAQTQLLLRISGNAVLDSRMQRDLIIIYGLSQRLSVSEIDEVLFSQNLPTLQPQK